MAVGLNSVTAKAIGRTLGYGAAGATVGVAARTIPTLLDSKKGSLTNRVDCAKEHIVNDSKAVLETAIPAAGVGIVAMKKPELLTQVANVVGKSIGKAGKWLAAKMPKGGFGTGLLNKVLKNPAKAGGIGLAIAGGLYLINRLCNHARNEGKIEQKYNDTGAIENATKNLVLNA